jgi:hypothetical protein
VGRQLQNVLRRPCPEDETVPRIPEARLDIWLLQPQQDRVDTQARKLGSEEFISLLGVPCRSMPGVQGLDSGLDEVTGVSSRTRPIP